MAKNKGLKMAKFMYETSKEMITEQPKNYGTGVEPLTVIEKLSKKIDIKVAIRNLHNPNDVDLKKCQLVVYLNGKVKYVSKKGAIETYTYERVEADWKVWHYINHRKVTYQGITFRNDKDKESFYKFCELCRACYRIDAEFENLRKTYKTKVENEKSA